MPYTAPTLLQMTDDLARSLGDSGKIFWTQDELERLCREALRTWNCYASYWRGRRQFNTSAGNHYYDLATLGLVVVPADQLSLINDLQYALVEPFSIPAPPYDVFPTTAQYSSAQINSAILQALRQYQFDAGMTATIESPTAIPIHPANTLQLPEQVADVRHVEIQFNAPGDPINLRRAFLRRQDEWLTQYYNPTDLIDSNLPYGYSFLYPITQPTLRIIPASSAPAMATIISLRSSSLPPVDFQWAAKWLALHYLLTMDGQSRDNARANYCKKRYDDALTIARLAASTAVGYINSRAITITPASEMDSYDPGYRNLSLALGQEPRDIINYGWNIIGVHPTPSIAAPLHAIGFDMFLEAPVTTDPIQIAPEHLQAVLDYAKHIAIFKIGGAEFFNTTQLFERFVMAAMEYNSKLSAESRNLWTMRDRAARDKEQRYQRRADPKSSEELQEVS